MPFMASSTSASTSSTLSASKTFSSFGFVLGCLGVNTVQQSSYGSIEVSKVLIFLAISYNLSYDKKRAFL